MLIIRLLGVFILCLALYQLLAGDLAWRMHAWGKRFEGVATERTPEWDFGRKVAGWLLLVFAAVLLLFPTPKEKPPPPPGLPPNLTYPTGR